MWTYGIVSQAGALDGPQRNLGKTDPVQAIIVDNKRFSDVDRNMLRTFTHRDSSVAKGGIVVDFIEWPKVGDFAAQLRLLDRTDIYVSSPGTALTYAPFLWDHRVFVALG